MSILYGFETDNTVIKYQVYLASAGKLLIQACNNHKSPISNFGRSKFLGYVGHIYVWIIRKQFLNLFSPYLDLRYVPFCDHISFCRIYGQIPRIALEWRDFLEFTLCLWSIYALKSRTCNISSLSAEENILFMKLDTIHLIYKF